jgi:hypothetical protein
MLWGSSFLLASLDDSSRPGRLLDGVAFGSTQPLSVVVDWLVLGLILFWLAASVAKHLATRAREYGLVAASVAGLLWIGEGIARVKAIIWPATLGIPSYSGDLFARRFVHLNRAGYRDAEHTLVPATGTRRLLLVGDSFAFGAGIANPNERFGEQLTRIVRERTGTHWESLNISQGDRHTLDEIRMLRDGLAYRPLIVVLLYVFNDMEYLANRFSFQPERRPAVFEAPHGIAGRLHPVRLMYWNSFLFQEMYARVRLLGLTLRGGADGGDPFIPYRDTAAVGSHIADLKRFVSLAQGSGAAAVIVPFDPLTANDERARDRYSRFVNSVRTANLPVWSLEGLFDGRRLSEITVNKLDVHPNAFANHLAAERVSGAALKLVSEIQ